MRWEEREEGRREGEGEKGERERERERERQKKGDCRKEREARQPETPFIRVERHTECRTST